MNNYYSHNGEDWVIDQLLEGLGIKTGWFVDVGAWDGIYLSNTYRLVHQGWQGVEVEGDLNRYEQLFKNMEKFKVWCVCSMVQAKGIAGLDRLLQNTPVPQDFEVLSVDVDSWDYWIWYYLEKYSPKIVVIEIDGGYADDEEWIQPEDRPARIRRRKFNGASRFSMNKLAEKKGYRLVCDPGNMIYLRNDLWK